MKQAISLFVLLLFCACNETGLSQSDLAPSGIVDPRANAADLPFIKRPWRRIEDLLDPIGSKKPKRTLLKPMYKKYVKEVQNKADILFVIDNSCTMHEERDKVSDNLDAFMKDFKTSDLDFQIAVISSHTNNSLFYGEPTILKNGDPLLEERFSERVRMEEVCDMAPALNASYLALSEPRKSGHNKGFLRDDAFLLMLIISDADEDHYKSDQYYYDFFTGLKPNEPYKVNISAIVGDQPDGCAGDGGDAMPGDQYIQLSKMTNGFVESICNEDYRESFSRLGKNLDALVNSFPLGETPNLAYPITVKVNGVVIDNDALNGWIYNQALNAIQFVGQYQPGTKAVIEINFMAYVEE